MLKTFIKFTLASVIGLFAYGQSASAAPVNIIANGGFETGDFTGWSTTSNGSGSCDTDWTVGTSGAATGCTNVGSPPEGSFAAYNSFDGDGPQVFELIQTIIVPFDLTSAILSYLSSYIVQNFGTSDRIIEIEIVPLSLVSVDPISPGVQDSGGFMPSSHDLFPMLKPHEGSAVDLVFRNVIPETFTGPAGFGLDDVKLMVDTAEQGVPTPGALALLGFGLLGLRLRRRTA